jgi:hypothetical protein
MRTLRLNLARALACMTALSVASLTCAFIPNVAHVQAQTQPFSLVISGPTSVITLGSQCDVAVNVTNTSPETIAIGENNDRKEAFKDYKIFVTDESSGTKLKQDLSKLEPGAPEKYQHSSHKTKHLQPGESLVETLPVCSLYPLSSGHKYGVQVERTQILGSGNVTSNIIEIAVAP